MTGAPDRPGRAHDGGPVPAGAHPLVLGGKRFSSAAPGVMAIVNCTPDSFFSRNRFGDSGAALDAVAAAVGAGADIIDIGGVRAGQEGEHVSAREEIARVLPVLEGTRERFPQVVISLDTWRSEVARAVSHTGIDLVNDTWEGFDPELVAVAADLGAGYVVSHSGGLPPRTDPVNVSYGAADEDVVEHVVDRLRAGAHRALEAGIPRSSILVDPTLDFGKTTAHSLALIRCLARVVDLDLPVLMALSRKDFVGETLDTEAADRLEGSLAGTAVAAWLGAACFRTHDVLATRRVLDMVASIRGDRPPARAERGR